MNIRQMLISFLLVGLFAFAMIAFAVNFAEENDGDISVLDDSRISNVYTGVNETVFRYNNKGIESEAGNVSSSFNEEDNSILATTTSILFSTVTAVGKSIMGIASSIFDVTLDPLLKVVISDRDTRVFVGTILTAILLFTITLLAWRLYRQGV